MFQTISFPYFSISGTKRLTLNSALAFGLIINPYLVKAEQDSARVNREGFAKSYAQESGGATVSENWTRIEFSKAFIDPIVVVELLNATVNSPYIVGIRNIDSLGFEISLKGCNNSLDAPLQEDINFSVLEHSQFPSIEPADTHIRQSFAWGECPTQSG